MMSEAGPRNGHTEGGGPTIRVKPFVEQSQQPFASIWNLVVMKASRAFSLEALVLRVVMAWSPGVSCIVLVQSESLLTGV